MKWSDVDGDCSEPPFDQSNTLGIDLAPDGTVHISCYLSPENLEPIADYGIANPEVECSPISWSMPLDRAVDELLDAHVTKDNRTITDVDGIDELRRVAEGLELAAQKLRACADGTPVPVLGDVK